jgi:hypothetical protein
MLSVLISPKAIILSGFLYLDIFIFEDAAQLAHYSFSAKTILPTFTGKWSLNFDGSYAAALSVSFKCAAFI